MSFPLPTDEERAALQAFANAYPRGDRAKGCRDWKDVLTMVYWYNARIWRDAAGSEDHGYVLHSIRNSRGPMWLDTIDIKPIK